MNVIFSDRSWEHFSYWLENDRSVAKKIMSLIKEIKSTPFEGTGKPEPLKYRYAGYWSRRIDREHRLVYRIHNDHIEIIQCRFHYGDE